MYMEEVNLAKFAPIVCRAQVLGSELVPSSFTVLQVLLLEFSVVSNKEVVQYNSPKMEAGSGARNNPWLLTTLRKIFKMA